MILNHIKKQEGKFQENEKEKGVATTISRHHHVRVNVDCLAILDAFSIQRGRVAKSIDF